MTNNIQEEIEDKIIDWVALGSGGRLIAFRPEGKTYLAVQKKGGYGGKELIFHIESFILPQEKSEFIREVIATDEMKSLKNLYFLFTIFREVMQSVSEEVWLISSGDFFAIADKLEPINGNDIFKFDSEKFAKYKISKNNFNLFLIQKLVTENTTRIKGGFKRRTY